MAPATRFLPRERGRLMTGHIFSRGRPAWRGARSPFPTKNVASCTKYHFGDEGRTRSETVLRARSTISAAKSAPEALDSRRPSQVRDVTRGGDHDPATQPTSTRGSPRFGIAKRSAWTPKAECAAGAIVTMFPDAQSIFTGSTSIAMRTWRCKLARATASRASRRGFRSAARSTKRKR